MNAPTSSGKGSDSAPDRNIFELSGEMKAGDVTLFFTGPEDPGKFLSTWLQTVAANAQQQDPDTPVVVIGLAPEVVGKENALVCLDELKGNPSCIDMAPDLVLLASEEADRLLAQYPADRKGAIVAITDLERFRTASSDTKERPVFETVDGTKVRLSELDELCLPHVAQLCVQIGQRAAEQGHRCLLLCRGFGFGKNIPAELQAMPRLDIAQAYPATTDPQLSEELRRFLGAIPREGIEAAWTWAENKFPPGKVLQVTRANLLSADGRHSEAYKAMALVKEQILQDGSSAAILQLAQLAAAAGDRAEARTLLSTESLLPVATLNFEALRAACILADDVGAEAARARYRQTLWSRFPNHPYSLLEQYRDRIVVHDYAACRALADRMGSAYRRALADFLETPVFPPDVLLRAAAAVDETPHALWTAATTAEDLGRFAESRGLARQLIDDPVWGGRALGLRARLLMADRDQWESDAFHIELTDLIAWVGEHPGELDAFFAVEAIFDHSGVGLHALAWTAFSLVAEVKRILATSSFKELDAKVHLLGKGSAGKSREGLVVPFMRKYFTKGKPNNLLIGVGRPPEELRGQLTPALLAEVGGLVEHSLDKDDSELLPLLAHIAVMTARELGDANSDLLVARSVASFFTRSAAPQNGLDYAVSFLFALPAAQPHHRSWRRCQAWAIYADVYERLHNPRAALRCALAAVLVLKEEPQNGNLFADLIRLCARIIRDLKIYPLARELVGMERVFAQLLPPSRLRERQLEQFDLSLQLFEWSPAQGESVLREIERQAERHLATCQPNEERAPMAAVLANVVRFMKLNGIQPSAGALNALAASVEKIPAGARRQLAGLTAPPTAERLRQMFAAVSSIRAPDDLGYALKPAEPAARDALAVAKDRGDSELFWLAALLLTQPAVALRLTELRTTPRGADPVAGTKWLASRIESGAGDALDAALVQRRLSHVSSEAKATDLFDITLAQFTGVIEPDEIVILLVSDDRGSVFRAVIMRAGAAPLEQLSPEEWSPDAYFSWQDRYPAAYGVEFTLVFGEVVKPSPAAVAESLAKLNPLARLPPSKITVIPEGRLFGFAYHLSAQQALPGSIVSIAPSARWLHETRSQARPEFQPAVAWLGSAQSQDEVLLALRTEVRPLLQAAAIAESTAESLPVMRRHDFVLIGSHGSLAEKNAAFAQVSDEQHTYEPDEMADSLGETNCAVLFVCHAGRVDQTAFAHSTTGLVSSLLRYGVRCVVAPLWPLDVRLATQWLQEFLLTDPNASIAERVHLAQIRMARSYRDHPLVKAVFGVFGDGSTRCQVAQRR